MSRRSSRRWLALGVAVEDEAATAEVDEVVDEAAAKTAVGEEEEEVISKLSTYAGRLLFRPRLFVFSCSVFRPLRVVDL